MPALCGPVPSTETTVSFSDLVRNTANTVKETVTNALDFSRWETEEVAPEVINDLGLTGDELVLISSQRHGLSEKLQSSFRFLRTKNGNLKSLLKASYAFEELDRDCTYEQLAQVIGCSCNTAYQYGLRLREAYENAFGIHITSTAEGLHITNVDEAQVQNDRVLANFEKHILPSLQRFGRQLRSLEQTNQQYSLSARTQALLQASLTDQEDGNN